MRERKSLFVVFGLLTIIATLVLGRVAFTMASDPIAQEWSKEGKANQAYMHYVTSAAIFNFMEPWKASYNGGTEAFKQGEIGIAEMLLTSSLTQVKYVYDECLIRNNLAIVFMKQAEMEAGSGMHDAAAEKYKKAVETVANTPGECFPPSSSSGNGDSEGEGSGEGEPSEEPNEGENGDGEEENPATPEEGEGDPAKPESNPDGKKGAQDAGKQLKEIGKEAQKRADAIEGEKGNGQGQVQEEANTNESNQTNEKDEEQQKENQKPNVKKPW